MHYTSFVQYFPYNFLNYFRSLEQKSTSHEKQSETELKLRREVEEYLKKEIKLEADNKKYLEKVKSLEEKLEKSEEAKKKMKEISDELTNELDNCKKHIEGNNNMKVVVEGYDEKLVKASEIIQKLKGKLKEVTIEKETLLSVIEAQNEKLEGSKTETEDLRKKNKDYERSIENLKNKNLADKSKYEFAIDNLKKSSQKLEEENKNLALEAEVIITTIVLVITIKSG